MVFLQFLLKTSWRTILIASAFGIVSGASNARLIALINGALREGTASQAPIVFVGLLGFTLAMSLLSQFLLIKLSQDAVYQLRMQLSRGILSSSLQHIEQLGDHRIFVALTEDIRILSRMVGTVPKICVDLSTIIGCLVYLAWLSGRVFVSLLVVLLATIWVIQLIARKARYLFRIAREEDDRLFGHFRTMTAGTKELKLHRSRREDFFVGDLETSAANLREKNTNAMKMFAIADNFSQFSLFAILGMILFVLSDLMPVSSALLASYVLTIMYLNMPLQGVQRHLPDLVRANVSIHKMEHMKLDLVQQAERMGDISVPVAQQAEIALSKVSYHYHPEGGEPGFHLGPVSLVLKPRQITYLIGGNGSGKSTIAKLISGLYSPEMGTLSLNGISIDDHNREWYRQHFSAIFSDFFLFDRYLGIDYVNRDQEIKNYLKQLRLDHKVQIRNGRLSTTRLSQGQRKRLALLTAYLEDRPVYIFDEWAADQEPAFRELFYTEILDKLKARGKTVLVITHDDRYFHLADQLLKLDYGRVQVNRSTAVV